LANSLPGGRQASDRFNQIQTDEKAKAALKNSELLKKF